MQGDGAHRPHEGTQLEQRPLLQCKGQVGRLVCRSEPAPRDQVGAGGDRSRQVDLERGEVVHELDKAGRPVRIQLLGTHRQLSRLGPVEAAHTHVPQASGHGSAPTTVVPTDRSHPFCPAGSSLPAAIACDHAPAV
jgi:hypothetical protein